MTTTEKLIGHTADIMHSLRPDFDVAGCVAALRKLDLPLGAVVIAAVRYAQDPANLTPAHLADFTNRAWDSDWHLPCARHPEETRRSTAGECRTCRSERLEDTTPRPAVEPRRPETPDWRAARAKFGRKAGASV